MKAKRISSWVLGMVVVAGVGVSFYTYKHKRAGDLVLAQILGVADDMDISPEFKDELHTLLGAAHEDAFARAFDISRALGRKFDTELYYKEIFDVVIARAREQGKDDLGDRIEREREYFSITVTER